MEEEKLLGVITRSGWNKSFWSVEDICLAFTNKRIMFLPAGTIQGIKLSSWIPVFGSLKAIAELKAQDRYETFSVEQLEKIMKFDIPISEIRKIDIRSKMLNMGTDIEIETASQTYKVASLEDRENFVQKIVDSFRSHMNT